MFLPTHRRSRSLHFFSGFFAMLFPQHSESWILSVYFRQELPCFLGVMLSKKGVGLTSFSKLRVALSTYSLPCFFSVFLSPLWVVVPQPRFSSVGTLFTKHWIIFTLLALASPTTCLSPDCLCQILWQIRPTLVAEVKLNTTGQKLLGVVFCVLDEVQLNKVVRGVSSAQRAGDFMMDVRFSQSLRSKLLPLFYPSPQDVKRFVWLLLRNFLFWSVLRTSLQLCGNISNTSLAKSGGERSEPNKKAPLGAAKQKAVRPLPSFLYAFCVPFSWRVVQPRRLVFWRLRWLSFETLRE